MAGLAAILTTYLGTASFLIDVAGTRILTDPGDLLTARLSEEGARSLPGVDLVLVTHGDFDHTNRLRSVAGIQGIPILAPQSVKRAFPDLNVVTDRDFRLGDATVTTVPGPDALFVTIGGFEANIENALAMVRSIRPRTVIPMHWEGLLRDDGKARAFARAVGEGPAPPVCIIAAPGVPVAVP